MINYYYKWKSFQEFDGTLDSISLASTCAFNRRGTLLAVGCNDGRIFIWDFLTRGIAKSISAHVYPVCSLSWSRNCKKVTISIEMLQNWNLVNCLSMYSSFPSFPMDVRKAAMEFIGQWAIAFCGCQPTFTLSILLNYAPLCYIYLF